MPGTLLSTEDREQSLSPLILFLVIGIQYPITVIRFSLCFLRSVHSIFGRRKHSISVQSFSRVLLFVTPWTAAHQAFLSITNTWLGLAQIHVHRVGDAIQPPQLALASGSLGVCSRPLPWVPNSMHFESVSLLSLGPCAVESIGEPEYG